MNPIPSPQSPFAVIAIAAVALGFATLSGPGCGTRPPKMSFQPATQGSLAALRDTEFRLTHLIVDGTQVDTTAFPISLRFDETGRVSGRSAVNRYFGGFSLGENGSLTWPPAGLGMTRMAGPEPAMQLEKTFTEVLTGSTRLLTSPTGARFENDDGRRIAEFSK
ncbi:MAG: META domain-containing protein [Limisphaerales bacterium]